MMPMMIASTRLPDANPWPRAGRRRPSLAGLAIACMLLATGCSLLGGGGTRERGTIYAPDPRVDADPSWPTRSEEHTSELQSLMRISYAVFCLKKKKTPTTH